MTKLDRLERLLAIFQDVKDLRERQIERLEGNLREYVFYELYAQHGANGSSDCVLPRRAALRAEIQRADSALFSRLSTTAQVHYRVFCDPMGYTLPPLPSNHPSSPPPVEVEYLPSQPGAKPNTGYFRRRRQHVAAD